MQTRIEKIDNSKQDTIEDTGWVDCELEDDISASSTGYGGAKGIQYRKIGNHVYVRGSVTFTCPSAGSVITLATLPYGTETYNEYFLVPCSRN